MTRVIAALLTWFCFVGLSVRAQSVHAVIDSVWQAQARLQSVSYSVKRTDTLVDGTIRTMTGRVMMKPDRQDRVFGFRFQAHQAGLPGESIYDGRLAYETNEQARTYVLTTQSEQIRQLPMSGRLIVPDLIRLDTTRAVGYQLMHESSYYDLILQYPDLTQYGVTNRYKTVRVDRATWLPQSIRQHQETLGKVQDLYWQLTDLTINRLAENAPFPSLAFLTTYGQQYIPVRKGSPALSLVDKPAPALSLPMDDTGLFSSKDFMGKVTLLDFWEVWCGPCVESMPKVQQLADGYASRNFRVIGIIHENGRKDLARQMMAKRGGTFPLVVGDEQSKRAYKLNAIPLYVLVNRKGVVRFVSEGYSPELEEWIQKLIQEE